MSELKTPIVNLKQIDAETREGRLLFAAVCSLARKEGKSPESILESLNQKAEKIYDNPDGHITKRSSGAELKTAVRGIDEASTQQAGNADMGD